MKELYLYADYDKLQAELFKKKSSTFSEQKYQKVVFSEEKQIPLHLGVCAALDYESSINQYKKLNEKVVQIKHVESGMLLSMTVKRSENKMLE